MLMQTLCLLLLAVCAVGPLASAQAPASLSIQTYAGLSITGGVGRVYTVQYNTNLAQADGWRGAGIVQLPSSPCLWVDTAVAATGRRFYRTVEGPTNVAWIPAGTFTMGSAETEAERLSYEDPQTVVTLTRGFFMEKNEVTQGEYLDVMGSNPSYFRNGTPGCCGGTGGAVTNELRHPVEQVSWLDSTNYCGKQTARELAAGRIPAGWRYRLPTEAEWEYACRGGTTSAFHYGPALRSGMANFNGQYEYDASAGTVNNPAGIFLGRTTLVGSYEANGWGLYDMHGNVWEWCSDVWSESLPGGRVVDPQGLAIGSYRVFRGGSWSYDAWRCRSAIRHGSRGPGSGNGYFGFRVVLAPGQ